MNPYHQQQYGYTGGYQQVQQTTYTGMQAYPGTGMQTLQVTGTTGMQRSPSPGIHTIPMVSSPGTQTMPMMPVHGMAMNLAPTGTQISYPTFQPSVTTGGVYTMSTQVQQPIMMQQPMMQPTIPVTPVIGTAGTIVQTTPSMTMITPSPVMGTVHTQGYVGIPSTSKQLYFNPRCEKCKGTGVTKKGKPCKICYSANGICVKCGGTGWNKKKNKACKKCHKH